MEMKRLHFAESGAMSRPRAISETGSEFAAGWRGRLAHGLVALAISAGFYALIALAVAVSIGIVEF